MIADLAVMFGATAGPVVAMVLGGYWATRNARPERRR